MQASLQSNAQWQWFHSYNPFDPTVHIGDSLVLAWRIPEMAEPGELLSVGSHRVGHDWSDLAAADFMRQKSNPTILLKNSLELSNVWKKKKRLKCLSMIFNTLSIICFLPNFHLPTLFCLPQKHTDLLSSRTAPCSLQALQYFMFFFMPEILYHSSLHPYQANSSSL